MIRKLFAAGAVALLALGLGACGVPYEESTSKQQGQVDLKKEQAPIGLSESTITLQDGRTVTCVVYNDAMAPQGGISCDWESAAEPR